MGGRHKAVPALAPNSEIPDKLYFKIGEVSQLVGVQAHVLRYWEKEVPTIRPTKSASNQRRYRRKDVEVFREIRRLLYEERYTLAGAKKRLTDGGDRRGTAPRVPAAPTPAFAVTNGSEQLPLGFVEPATDEVVKRLKSGLRDLIRISGENP